MRRTCDALYVDSDVPIFLSHAHHCAIHSWWESMHWYKFTPVPEEGSYRAVPSVQKIRWFWMSTSRDVMLAWALWIGRDSRVCIWPPRCRDWNFPDAETSNCVLPVSTLTEGVSIGTTQQVEFPKVHIAPNLASFPITSQFVARHTFTLKAAFFVDALLHAGSISWSQGTSTLIDVIAGCSIH